MEMVRTADGPDWSAHAETVLCPLCDYNLRGIAEPRCPECGYRFQWDEVLYPEKRPHPYLFETRPQQNVLAFLRTLSGGLRPWRFWRTLYPSQPSGLRRLAMYLLLVNLPLLVAIIITLVSACLESETMRQAARTRYMAQISAARNGVLELPGGIRTIVAGPDRAYPARIWPPIYMQRGQVWQLYHMMLTPLTPILAVCVLLIFRISMQRARICPLHVWRCVVYSWDHVLYAGILALTVAIWDMSHGGRASVALPLLFTGLGPAWSSHVLPAYAVLHWALVACVLLFAFRLYFAYRMYLRFDHPGATVFCTYTIMLLLIALVALVI